MSANGQTYQIKPILHKIIIFEFGWTMRSVVSGDTIRWWYKWLILSVHTRTSDAMFRFCYLANLLLGVKCRNAVMRQAIYHFFTRSIQFIGWLAFVWCLFELNRFFWNDWMNRVWSGMGLGGGKISEKIQK